MHQRQAATTSQNRKHHTFKMGVEGDIAAFLQITWIDARDLITEARIKNKSKTTTSAFTGAGTEVVNEVDRSIADDDQLKRMVLDIWENDKTQEERDALRAKKKASKSRVEAESKKRQEDLALQRKDAAILSGGEKAAAGLCALYCCEIL